MTLTQGVDDQRQERRRQAHMINSANSQKGVLTRFRLGTACRSTYKVHRGGTIQAPGHQGSRSAQEILQETLFYSLYSLARRPFKTGVSFIPDIPL